MFIGHIRYSLGVIMSRPGLNRTIVNSESKNRSSIELRDDNKKHIIILILLRRKDSDLQPSDSKSDATANCATAQYVSNASTLDTNERMTSFVHNKYYDIT